MEKLGEGQENKTVFTKEELSALLMLLNRVDLKGAEVAGFIQIVNKLNALAKELT